MPDEKPQLLTGHGSEAMTNRYDYATESDIELLAEAQRRKILPLLAGGCAGSA